MNKKFLSAVLFGALMVSSTGTFVSCKDYDDDIDGLDQRLTAVENTIKDINTSISNGLIITDVDPITKDGVGGIKITFSDNSTKEVWNGKNGSNADIWTIDAEGYWCKNNVRYVDATGQPISAKGQNGSGADGQTIYYMPGTTGAEKGFWVKVTVKGNADGTDKREITDINVFAEGSITAVMDGDSLFLSGVAGHEGILEIPLNSKLKSLVFKPEMYLDGVEAMEYKYIPYKALPKAFEGNEYNWKKGDVKYFTKEKQDLWKTLATKWTIIDPTYKEDYHMNPSSAKVAEFKDALSFVSDDKDFVSTRTAISGPKASYITNDGGILTVGVKLTGRLAATQAPYEEINLEDGDFGWYPYNTQADWQKVENKITTLALQANLKNGDADTTITSDYAAVYGSQIKIEAIAYPEEVVTCDEPNNHLYKSIVDAINEKNTASVAWNSSIDLRTLTCVHYHSNSESSFGNNGEVKVFGEEDLAAYGLKLKYELADYHAGENNKTSESANAAIREDGYTLEPRRVNSQGETMAEQGIETVGRMPMVRVTLYNVATDEIIKIGYIKLLIIESETPKVTDIFNKGNWYYSCDIQDVKLTWSETQYQLLGLTVASSKDEFDVLYKLETIADVAVQYYKDGNVYKTAPAWTSGAGLPFIVGQISEVADPEAHETTCLLWNIGRDDYEHLRQANKYTIDHTVYVKYIGKNETATGATKTPIYLPIKVTLNYPQGKLGNKIPKYWYAADKKDAGNDDVHFNVVVPGTLTNDCAFANDINNVFAKNTTLGSAIAPAVYTSNCPSFGYPATEKNFVDWVDAKLSYVYYFAASNNEIEVTGASNSKYTLKVDHTKTVNYDKYDANTDCEYNNDKLYVGTTVIAEINQTTGVVTYQDNTIAKDILNYMGHNKLGVKETFTAEVGVAAFNSCANLLPLADKYFSAKFLRPVDVEKNNFEGFTDAVDNGDQVNLLKLVKLNDWRDQDFITSTANTDGKNLNYFNYYGVEDLYVDVKSIKTDMMGEWKLLSEVSDKVYFELLDASGNVRTATPIAGVPAANVSYASLMKHYADLRYVNNTANVQTFNVKVPVTLKYKWGEYTVEIEIQCKHTLNNGN